MDKLHHLTHYIISRCDEPSVLGATKLNKILWFSDAWAYMRLGSPITEARYEKRQFGPVPSGILNVQNNLVKNGRIILRQGAYGGYPQTQFVSLTTPDINGFSGPQISLVDSIISDICHNHTAASISQASHDIVWDAAELGEEIPLYAVFASRQAELTGDDVVWAREQMQSVGA